jgi:hypothetical protein
VKLRLAENLSSATAKARQSVPFELLEEVDVQGVPVIAKGAQALATATIAETKKSMGRPGKARCECRLGAAGGQRESCAERDPVCQGWWAHGRDDGGDCGDGDCVFPGGTAAAIYSWQDITIPKGTEITAFVAGDMKLDMAKFTAPAGGVAVAPVPAASGLTIEASVPNCDIEVDGELRREYTFYAEPRARKTRDRGAEDRVSGLVAQHDGGWWECQAECGDGGEVGLLAGSSRAVRAFRRECPP